MTKKKAKKKAKESDLIRFDYDKLGALGPQIKTLAGMMRSKLVISSKMLIESGITLLKIKEALPHGDYTPWLVAEARLHPRATQRLSGLAVLAQKCDSVSYLRATTLYALTSPTVAPEVRDRVLATIIAERPPDEEIRSLLLAARQDGSDKSEPAADAAIIEELITALIDTIVAAVAVQRDDSLKALRALEPREFKLRVLKRLLATKAQSTELAAHAGDFARGDG